MRRASLSMRTSLSKCRPEILIQLCKASLHRLTHDDDDVAQNALNALLNLETEALAAHREELVRLLSSKRTRVRGSAAALLFTIRDAGLDSCDLSDILCNESSFWNDNMRDSLLKSILEGQVDDANVIWAARSLFDYWVGQGCEEAVHIVESLYAPGMPGFDAAREEYNSAVSGEVSGICTMKDEEQAARLALAYAATDIAGLRHYRQARRAKLEEKFKPQRDLEDQLASFQAIWLQRAVWAAPGKWEALQAAVEDARLIGYRVMLSAANQDEHMEAKAALQEAKENVNKLMNEALNEAERSQKVGIKAIGQTRFGQSRPRDALE